MLLLKIPATLSKRGSKQVFSRKYCEVFKSNSFERDGAWGGGGEGVVFAGGQEEKIFSTVFRDFGKDVKWDLKDIVGKRYFQHKTVPVIPRKNNKKLWFEIFIKGISIFGHLFLKNYFLVLTLFRFLKHLEDF